MVKSIDDGSSSIAPFLRKCFEMVDDGSTDSIISWSENNDSFVVWDMTEFSVQLLPQYFKHSNFSSFIRQLNIYVSFLNLFLLVTRNSIFSIFQLSALYEFDDSIIYVLLLLIDQLSSWYSASSLLFCLANCLFL